MSWFDALVAAAFWGGVVALVALVGVVLSKQKLRRYWAVLFCVSAGVAIACASVVAAVVGDIGE